MSWLEQRPSKIPLGRFWPLAMTFIRLPLALTGSAIAVQIYQLNGNPVGIGAGLGWSTFTLTIVNLICLWLILWRSKVEGFEIKQIVGFRWRALGRDLAWGFLLSLLLGGLLLAGVFTVIFLLHGLGGFGNLGTVFAGEVNFSFTLPYWLSLVSAVVFPLLNPFVEELQYRGYAQPRLVAASSLLAGILIPAVGFGLQHVVFAVTPSAALAYVTGFFLWGLGAGLIAYRQGRLVQLIVAHFISNLSFGIIPLFFINDRY